MELLSSSYNFIDDSFVIIASVIGNKYNFSNYIQPIEGYSYNFEDFLYFSMVSITTLGFGDILPNSTIVRRCVMLETVTGLFLLSLFGLSFSKKDKT